MVNVEIVVNIDRPIEDVFAYLCDVEKEPEWNSMVDEVTCSDHPLRIGSIAHLKMRLLGRRIEATLDGLSEHQELLAGLRALVRMVRSEPA